MSDKERAEFEGWAQSNFILILSDGEYINPYTKTAYSSWKASAERSAKRIAELEAEVAWCKRLIRDECINPQQLGAIDDEAMKGGA